MKTLLFYTLLSASLYYVKEPYKARTKELCSRPAVINKPEKKEGKLFERSMNMYDMPRYKYKTGFPTLGIEYKIIRL